MNIGDLVTSGRYCEPASPQPRHWAKFDGKIGIVINQRPRWPDNSREDEMIIEVLYPELGIKEEWGEYDLEVISESR